MRKDNKAACVFVKITKRILTLEEKADPDVFAENVRQLMTNEAGIPMADQSALHYLEEILKAHARILPRVKGIRMEEIFSLQK